MVSRELLWEQADYDRKLKPEVVGALVEFLDTETKPNIVDKSRFNAWVAICHLTVFSEKAIMAAKRARCQALTPHLARFVAFIDAQEYAYKVAGLEVLRNVCTLMRLCLEWGA